MNCTLPQNPISIRKRARDGFTLREVLALVVTVAVLGLWCIPALAQNRNNSGVIRCKANMAALTFGWLLYAEDHNGSLVPNYLGVRTWVAGNVSVMPGATNISAVRSGLLWPYVQDLNVYKCPDDRAFLQRRLRVRTVSMSWRMNPDPLAQFANPSLAPWKTLYSIFQPSPSRALVFVDESTDSIPARCSIDDGMFVIRVDTKNNGFWQNTPASRHGNFGVVSMADGHVETWKWSEPTTSQLFGLDKQTRPGDKDFERFRRATVEP